MGRWGGEGKWRWGGGQTEDDVKGEGANRWGGKVKVLGVFRVRQKCDVKIKNNILSFKNKKTLL